jgi:hypothetical protein
MDDRKMGIRFSASAQIFLLAIASRRVLGPTQPLTQWMPGTFPGTVSSRCEADHSPPASAEV